MNEIQANVLHIVSLVSIFGIVVLFFFLYKDYRKDLYRERLFQLRDNLFMLGAQGHLDFTSKSYGLMRSIINASIRNGHRWGFVELTAHRLFTHNDPVFQESKAVFTELWKRELASLPEDSRKKLMGIRMEFHYICLEQLFFTSAVVQATVVPVLTWMIIKGIGGELVNRAKAWSEKISDIIFSVDFDVATIISSDQELALCNEESPA